MTIQKIVLTKTPKNLRIEAHNTYWAALPGYNPYLAKREG
jgi:hypothetical protein